MQNNNNVLVFFVQWCVGRIWTAQLLLFIWMKSTAKHAMVRSMGQKATVMAREQEPSAWTKASPWELNMKSE